MNEEAQLKLQAYADGELTGPEARNMADLLARDADARALLAELRHTREALTGYEAEIKLPESREFYWSKIERGIHRLEPAETPREETSWWAGWRRLFVPAGALAALVILVVLAVPALHGPRATASISAETEFALADSGAFTYHDYANGTTLVWLGYPAEGEFSEGDFNDTFN